MHLGLAYLSQENMVLAKKKLLQALTQNPLSASVNSSMAYFMEKTGDNKLAEGYYRRAMLLAPKKGEELNNYGAYLCRNGYYQKAEEYFMLAVNDVNYVDTAAAYENAGLCALSIPSIKRAIGHFKKALAQDPSRKRPLQEIVRLELMKNHIYTVCRYLHHYSAIVRLDEVLYKIKMKMC
jgi:type IV pilus assembly protein PilF